MTWADGVCRPMALMLLCEFILNSTRAPPGEEFLYHTLLELHLMGDGEDQDSQSASSATAESAVQGVSASSQHISDASSSQVGSEHQTVTVTVTVAVAVAVTVTVSATATAKYQGLSAAQPTEPCSTSPEPASAHLTQYKP
jgi:hypothetical protein